MAIFKVETERGRVLLETDDWVEAEQWALVQNWSDHRSPLNIRGTHPTHDWSGPRKHGGSAMVRTCANCGGYDNGSYGSHAPCGYEWDGPGGSSLVAALEREMAARKANHA